MIHYRTRSPTIARALLGLAAPIRSARIRARTVMFNYSSDFHRSCVNPTISCTSPQNRKKDCNYLAPV